MTGIHTLHRPQRHSAAGLALGLALALGALPAGADDARGLDTDRERSVTHNDDGTVQIDRRFDRLHRPSGRTATGDSTTVVTPGEDGASWESTGSRTTLRGASVEGEASGSRSRDGEGGLSASGTRSLTRTGADGESKSRTVDWERDRSVTQNDDGSVTIDKSWRRRTRSPARPPRAPPARP